jgi:hypothetical protein
LSLLTDPLWEHYLLDLVRGDVVETPVGESVPRP